MSVHDSLKKAEDLGLPPVVARAFVAGASFASMATMHSVPALVREAVSNLARNPRQIETLRGLLLTAIVVADSDAAFAATIANPLTTDGRPLGGDRSTHPDDNRERPLNFTRTDFGATRHLRLYDGDDGFEYLVAITEIGAPDIMYGGDIVMGEGTVTSGWSLVSQTLFVVELDEPLGVAGFSKEPGPVVCSLYRREKQ